MSADQIAAFTAAARLLDEIGGWPLASVILTVVVGPWLLAFILARGQERRFEAVKEMYRRNASLVENYEKTCTLQDRREEDLRTIIMMNTQAMTRLTEVIKQGRG